MQLKPVEAESFYMSGIKNVTLTKNYSASPSDDRLRIPKDKIITIDLNGYMINPYWSTTVAAGKRKLASVTFSESSLSDSGITELVEIDFKLKVRDYDNWLSDDIVNEVYTYYPQA